MANSSSISKLFGAIANGSHATVSRSIQKSDNCTMEVQIVGDYKTLENIVAGSNIGASANTISGEFEVSSSYKIKTLTASREEGDVGVLNASLVNAPDLNNPYHITYSVDMVEDQRPLLRHPVFKKNPASFNIIRQWMDSPLTVRVKYGSQKSTEGSGSSSGSTGSGSSGGSSSGSTGSGSSSNPSTNNNEVHYYYREYVSGTESEGDRTGLTGSYKDHEITDDTALKYCKAFMAGIEHYNVYLPVVSVVSLYLKTPPGISQDDTTHAVSGNLRFSKGIGKWDNSFGFSIDGFPDDNTGGWFKSQDQWSQNSDGTWQRTEQYTYSDSKEHAWIYEEAK